MILLLSVCNLHLGKNGHVYDEKNIAFIANCYLRMARVSSLKYPECFLYHRKKMSFATSFQIFREGTGKSKTVKFENET